MPNRYWLLRGCLWVGDRTAAGVKIGGEELHNVDLEITVEQTRIQHKNTCSEVTEIDAEDVVETMVKVKMTIDQITAKMLAMALAGEVTEQATGDTFTAQLFPTGVAVGDKRPVPGGFMNLASLVLTDSNGTPATLTAGTHYTADLIAGIVEFLNLASYTQPFKAAGEENDDFDIISIATELKKEKWVRFKGINLNDNNYPVLLDLHRVSFAPVTAQLKNAGNEYSQFAFEPQVLTDEDAPMVDDFGKYGRMISANA
jgi:hypothetical protein